MQSNTFTIFQLICVCLFFLTVISHQQNKSKSTTTDAFFLERLHHIKETFRQLKDHVPHLSIIDQLFSHEVELIKRKREKLKRCYEESVGNESVNIFSLPLGTVLERFAKHHHNEIFGGEGKTSHHHQPTIIHRLKNLIKTVKSLAKVVIECLKSEDDDPTKLGLTRFSALSSEEFAATYLLQPETNTTTTLFKFGPLGRVPGEKILGELPTSDEEDCYVEEEEEEERANQEKIPPEYDYRQQRGVISPVADQGHCATCYLIAAVDAMQSAYMLKHGLPPLKGGNQKTKSTTTSSSIRFSEKDLFNCLVALGYATEKSICKAGRVEHVFRVAAEHGLVERSKGEPYEVSAVQRPVLRPKNCHQPLPSGLLAARLRLFCKKSHLPAPPSGDRLLQRLLLKYGPVVVPFRAVHEPFWLNLRGPYNRRCRAGAPITHTGLLVGYSRTHWIIKGTYGSADWGLAGYLLVKRTEEVAASCGLFGPGSFAMVPFV